MTFLRLNNIIQDRDLWSYTSKLRVTYTITSCSNSDAQALGVPKPSTVRTISLTVDVSMPCLPSYLTCHGACMFETR